jgi:dihydrofolate synthase / folylpolyglutamate synthase
VSTSDDERRYRAAVASLQERGRFGIRLGLGRTRALLRELGSPELQLRGALVGGTNGKGSVQAMVGAVLRQQGLLVGQMPKPHLVEYRERIVIDGQPLPAGVFAETVERALAAAKAIERRHGAPTEFEVLTAGAFYAFARAGIDVLVAEVGMGGRLDATNAWQGGVSAITNVALDHTEHLGPTVVAIAREKAAIIKRGDTAAITGAEDAALAVIRRRARRVAVPLQVVEPLAVQRMDRGGLLATLPDATQLRIGLLGRHQAHNAAMALAVLEALTAAGLARHDPAALERGLAGVRWPGRLELLPSGAADTPEVLLDGAHNAHGAAALGAAFEELRPHLAGGRPVLLLGIMRDKEIGAMLAALRQSAGLAGAEVVTTTVPDAPRALSADALAVAWGSDATPIDDADAALRQARARAVATGGPLVVCGSLYLVGHVREQLLSNA